MLAITQSRAELIQALVLDVVDGDTLQVVDTLRKVTLVRLAGIDAPQLSQSFVQASKQSLSTMVNGDYVSVHVHRVDAQGLWSESAPLAPWTYKAQPGR